MEADVSAIADPNTGVAVYQSGAWQVYGGTSVASPLVAGIFTLLDLNGQSPQFAWTHTSDFYDVTTGSNGKLRQRRVHRAASVTTGRPAGARPNGAALAGGTSSSSSVEQRQLQRVEQRQQQRVEQRQQQRRRAAARSSGSSSRLEQRDRAAAAAAVRAAAAQRQQQRLEQRQQQRRRHLLARRVLARARPLTSTCSTCAGDVCAKDPYCCQVQWDGICVSEVPQVLRRELHGRRWRQQQRGKQQRGSSSGGSSSGGGGGGGTCSHNVCKAGKPLTETCSTCADDVCTNDPYCCTRSGTTSASARSTPTAAGPPARSDGQGAWCFEAPGSCRRAPIPDGLVGTHRGYAPAALARVFAGDYFLRKNACPTPSPPGPRSPSAPPRTRTTASPRSTRSTRRRRSCPTR